MFGLGFAAILFSAAEGKTSLDSFAISTISLAFLSGSALVFIATKGKHPGWIGLLAVAVLVYLGSAG